MTYENALNNLGNISIDFQKRIETDKLDDYMKTKLLKIANSRERQMIQTGQISPKSTQFIRPLDIYEERD